VLSVALNSPAAAMAQNSQHRSLVFNPHLMSLARPAPSRGSIFRNFLASGRAGPQYRRIKYRLGSPGALSDSIGYALAIDPLRKFDLTAHIGRGNSCPERDNL
jgi:hypothetical protein